MSTLVLVEAVTSLGPLRDGVIDNDNCQVLEGDRSLFSKFMVSDEYARMSVRGIAGRDQRKEFLWTRSFPEFTAVFFRLG